MTLQPAFGVMAKPGNEFQLFTYINPFKWVGAQLFFDTPRLEERKNRPFCFFAAAASCDPLRPLTHTAMHVPCKKRKKPFTIFV